MDISFNISSPTIPPPQIGDTSQAKQTEQATKTLTISITNGLTGTDAAGMPTGITLSYPLVDLDKIALDKVIGQLKNLDLNTLKGMTLAAAVLQLNQSVGEIASAMIKGGKAFVEENAEQLTKFFEGVEKQAQRAERQMFDVINNSSYPDFSTFLSKLLEVAQQLRQLASEAKHSLVLADYNNTLDQAKQMEIAAQKNYDSTMKEIKAAQMEAIAKIVSGAVSILSIGAAGLAGGAAASQGERALGAMQQAGMLGSPIGNALGQIAEGIAGVKAGEERMAAAADKKEADLALALKTKMEATGKLLQEAEQITDELRDIAKTLADAVLKAHQDFMANQHEILQRANI